MQQAFYYMFKDAEFFKKTYVFFIFILFATLLSNYSNLIQPNPITGSSWYYILLSFITAVAMFVPQGYFLSVIKSVNNQSGDYFLPSVTMKRCFIQGLKVSVAFGLLYFLIISLLSILLTISIVAGMTTGVKTYFYITIFVILFVLLLLVFYLPVFTWMFAFKDNFLTYFRYILATKIFCVDVKRYLLSFVVLACITMLVVFVTGLLSNPIYLQNPFLFALITILDSIILYYVMFVFAYLIAKSINQIGAFELLGVFQYETVNSDSAEDVAENSNDVNLEENQEVQGYIEGNSENNSEENNNEN